MWDGSAVIVCSTSIKTDFFIVASSSAFRRLVSTMEIHSGAGSPLRRDNHVRSPSLGEMLLADACGDV
jgi:hypothetical protein